MSTLPTWLTETQREPVAIFYMSLFNSGGREHIGVRFTLFRRLQEKCGCNCWPQTTESQCNIIYAQAMCSLVGSGCKSTLSGNIHTEHRAAHRCLGFGTFWKQSEHAFKRLASDTLWSQDVLKSQSGSIICLDMDPANQINSDQVIGFLSLGRFVHMRQRFEDSMIVFHWVNLVPRLQPICMLPVAMTS